jgi:MFS family permease
MTTGGVLSTLGMAWLTQLDLTSGYVTHILPSFVAISVGMGLIFVPLANTSLTGVAPHDAGVASAMVNTTQQIGGSLGTALLNTIFTTTVAGYLTIHGIGAASQAHAAIHGYNVAFWVSAGGLALATVLIALFITSDADTPEAAIEAGSDEVGTGEGEVLTPAPAV